MSDRLFKAKVRKVGSNCATIVTGSEFRYGARPRDPWGTFGGRPVTFKVCAVANGIQISRGGRRGGIRSVEKRQGGMLLCTAHGADSKCIRAKSAVVFPGGGAKTRKWARSAGKGPMVLNGLAGYSRKHRRKRRTSRGSKRGR